MTDQRRFRDEDLTAYLDGEADATLEAAITAALETDEELGQRMAALDVPLAAIAQAFDGLLAAAPSMPDIDRTAPKSSEHDADDPDAGVRQSNAPQAANTNARLGWAWGLGTFGTGLAAGLAVALFTGFGTPEPEPRGWVSFVASYQKLYTTKTLESVTPTPMDAAQQLAIVSSGIGIDLAALPQTDGLTFKRAQLLGFNGKPLVQISYLRDDGTPVALCIIAAGPEARGLNMGAAEGLDVARWNTPGFGFLLIGGQDTAPLEREAETFRDWSLDITT